MRTEALGFQLWSIDVLTCVVVRDRTRFQLVLKILQDRARESSCRGVEGDVWTISDSGLKTCFAGAL